MKGLNHDAEYKMITTTDASTTDKWPPIYHVSMKMTVHTFFHNFFIFLFAFGLIFKLKKFIFFIR